MAIVALVVANGFEQAEMTGLCRGLTEAGHAFKVLSPKKHEARAWENWRWNGEIPVDVAAVDAHAGDYDALVIPGGVLSADTLRSDQQIIRLAADAARQSLPVAAMGHAAWVLIEAGLVKGAQVTSHPAIRSDLVNAGGTWRDEGAVADGVVITGRHSHDLPEFLTRVALALR